MNKTVVFILAVSLLLLAPSGGNLSLFGVLDKVGSRLSQPVNAQEQLELDFLSCLEETAGVIPDLGKVEKVIPDDSYLVQRVGDVMFPRIRFETEFPEYRLYVNADPGSAELIAFATCGQFFVGVEKVG